MFDTKADQAPMTGAAAAQRARGDLLVSARRRDGTSVIADLRQQGALKALFPRGPGGALEAVFLNTAGGLTGGDRMRITAHAGPDAHLRLSSQAAERAYRALPDSRASVDVALSVAAGGRIDWLPQETILFDGAALDRRLTLDLEPGARALVAEPLILGRAAMGEVVRDLWLTDRWSVRRGGALVFADALRIVGDATARMAQTGIGAGAGAAASVIHAAPDAGARLDPLRAMLSDMQVPARAGASLVRDDILFLRALARDGVALRALLLPVLEFLGGHALPKVWRL